MATMAVTKQTGAALIFLLGAAVFLNYVDRGAIAIAAPVMKGELGLTPEQQRVLERYHIGFRRAGAHLDDTAKSRLAAISERLATLGTTFSQNVLADEQDYKLIIEDANDLAGLPQSARAAAAEAANECGFGAVA